MVRRHIMLDHRFLRLLTFILVHIIVSTFLFFYSKIAQENRDERECGVRPRNETVLRGPSALSALLLIL